MNRNTVPFDERPPTVASGVRIGTPAATMRGFDEEDFREVGAIIVGALADDADCRRSRPAARPLQPRPLYPGFRGYTEVRRVSDDASPERHRGRPPPRPAQARPAARRDDDDAEFRQLVNELTLLSTYKATKGLADEQVEIETPLERTAVRRISGKKVAVCPILRAGVGMLDGVLSLIPGARVGFIGLYRDEETLSRSSTT